MSLTIDVPATDRPELIEFRRQDVAIAEMSEKYLPLKINGLDDKAGFKAVHDARMVVKNTRVTVEKKRKELKEDALRYGQAVDAEARRLAKLLEPIETHLQAEEDAVVNERNRLKQIEEDAKRAALQKRLDALASFGIVGNPLSVANMTEEAFQSEVARAKAAFEERQKAEAEATEKRRAEEVALKAERERLAAIQKQQEEEAARIRAEQHKLDIEKAKAEAAEKARIETEQRLAREAAAKQAAEVARIAREKAEAEAKEQARLKAEREKPYREKLLGVVRALELIEVPEGPADDAVHGILVRASDEIRAIAEGPL